MSKKKPKFNEEAAIRGALRRTFARSPIVVEKVQESRREEPRYNKDGSRHKKNWVKRQCEVCNNWVKSGDIAVDHIVPVISVEEGKLDWNTFIERLFCDKNNLQRICSSCHDVKTQKERIERLSLKYTSELDSLELTITSLPKREAIKILNKYISKKKSDGLKHISERAQKIKESLT